MITKELETYLNEHENGVEVAIKAVAKLLRNKKAGEETQGELSTLCSATCSKRGVYEIYTMMNLIKLVRYDQEINAKYFEVIDENGLLEVEKEIKERYL